MRLTIIRVLLMGLVASGGAGAAAYYGGVIDKPTFGIADKGDWGTVTDDRVDIHSTLWVHNPNPLGINITDVRATYRIQMNGVALAEGEKNRISVQEGNNTIELTTSLRHRNVPQWWARHLQDGEESTLTASAQVFLGFLPTAPTLDGLTHTDTIQTDIIGKLDTALSKIKGTYTGPGTTVAGVDTRPRVEVRGGSAAWGRITQETTRLRVTLNIHNPNSYPIPVPGLDGDLTMNDVTVGIWNSDSVQVVDAPADRVIPPGATRTTAFRIAIDNANIDDWFTSHVKNSEHTDASTTMRFRFDIGDIQLYVPQDGGLTCTFSFTTAILEDRNTSGGTFNGCNSGTMPTTDQPPSNTDQQDSSNDTQDSTDNSTSTDSTSDDSDSGVIDGITGNMGK